jgi:hypothetical protein
MMDDRTKLEQKIQSNQASYVEQLIWKVIQILPEATVVQESKTLHSLLESFSCESFRYNDIQLPEEFPSEDEAIFIYQGQFSDENGLVLVVTDNALELRLPTLEWDIHTPREVSKLWRHISLQEQPELDLRQLIADAQAAQKETFGDCKYCGKRNPEGWMHDRDVCQSCAENILGIRY